MKGLAIVTGATGHLGSNLVRALIARGVPVRATVRDPGRARALEGLRAEVVRADLMDKQSLLRALQGVDTLFQVAAVFKHWSRNPQRDIIVPNVTGTQNVLEAAAEAGVRRVVYVSSSATLDSGPGLIDERNWRAEDFGNPYVRSKIQSERDAWGLAKELGLDMVSVLPTAIIGPSFDRLSLSMSLPDRMIKGQFVASPDFRFTFVDVRDVADGMISAAESGRSGERYLLGGERSMDMRHMAELAREFVPGVPTPRLIPRGAAMAMATLIEGWARLSGSDPALLRSQVQLWCGVVENFDTSKARRDLGWQPRPSDEAVRECFSFLMSASKDVRSEHLGAAPAPRST